MKLQILKFLNDGDFMGIHPGATKAEVIRQIGEPKGWASSSTSEEIDEFMEANIWGYGGWVIWFDNDLVDAITGSLSGEEFEYSDFGEEEEVKFQEINIDQFVDALEESSIDYYRAPKVLEFIDKDGNRIQRRKRLAFESIYMGTRLESRVTIENGKIFQLAHPCSIISQAIGMSCTESARKKGWSLVR
ncbi:hypothetical protein ACJJJB_02430 [Microbulbifer sp. ANSA001]|uniref:hypothetical protein n=1 Tax=Microbulbifer sp. ANSA001 TaxID=3243358 RepID=UPI00404151B7